MSFSKGSLFNQLVLRCTGNQFVQKLLEKNVAVTHGLMGIGAGGGVESSGEGVVLDLLKQRFQAPYCIFDVGSNQGQYLSVLLRSLPSGSATIHCFEPSDWTFNNLHKGFGHVQDVHLNHLALGQAPGKGILYSDSDGSGLASLSQRRLDHFNIHFQQSETVKINTLDHYCLEKSVDRIHLLKIDVEGHELDVLAGASQMFQRQAIDLVTFEFGGCNIDTRSFFQDFYYFFQSQKMDLARITPSGYLYPIKAYREILEQFRTTNFVAIRNNQRRDNGE